MHPLKLSKALFISLFAFAPAVALADDPVPVPDENDDTTEPADEETEAGTTPGATAPPDDPSELPEPQSDDDVAPQVASPGGPEGGIVHQAGIGGLIGYGRAGVMEIGGSAGMTFASDYRDLNLSPTIGYFIADNLEASAILSISNVKAGEETATLWSALAEPSYHLPFNRSAFAFLGVGMGASHISGVGTGFAMAPRLGANLMVGRSGVLTPSVSYMYTTIKTDMAVDDVTVVALTGSMRFNLGFTAMW